MDFGTLLHVAKKNSEATKSESKYYSTKFAPPKKESKESKKLSENIQKFLQKKEQEERERQRIEKEKLANLLAQRDEKSKNKIRKMLKVTKSANKSVLDDAIDAEHTAVTMSGVDQPDQDDYGYVSTEANKFYQKYIEKVKDVKEDKGFAPSRPQTYKDIASTKERVKAALTREIEEKSQGRQRSTTTKEASAAKEPTVKEHKPRQSSKPLWDPEAERKAEEEKKREEERKRAKLRKPAPPPMDFQALLKLAEQKQHEPIEIPVEAPKQPERLLTSKEKREMEERQREKEARERRKREQEIDRLRKPETAKVRRTENATAPVRKSDTQQKKPGDPTNARIPKIASASAAKIAPASNGFKKPISNATASSRPTPTPAKAIQPTSNSKPAISPAHNKNSSAAAGKSSSSAGAVRATTKPTTVGSSNKYQPTATREFPPRDINAIKPRQFPPPDVARSVPKDARKGAPLGRASDMRRPPSLPLSANKRRIIDEDDEDEYDSELDDFIDDGDEEEDYSSHIKAIFGYDKSRYRDIDDEDDAAMESNFAQVQREEYISKKIGIQEDLEDMRQEALEKQRKKKRRL